MGGCLTTTDSSSSINDNADSETTKKDSHSPDMYCNDWLKFPICCPYCSNHSEPSSEFQLVILGPGYTGKTTLRHHLVQRYGHAFCKADFLMYRDILQHNVLDLFRDLLQKPSLTFTELREFISYIHKQRKDSPFETVLSCDNYCESEVTEQELDLGLHDLDASDTDMCVNIENEYKYNIHKNKHYLCQPNIDKHAIHSNSSSLMSVDSDNISSNSMAYNIVLNDTKYANDIIINNNCNEIIDINNNLNPDTKTPFSSPQIIHKSASNSSLNTLNDIHSLNISMSPLYDSDNEYKYCSINQYSPNTPGNNIKDNINFDSAFNNNNNNNMSLSVSPPTHTQTPKNILDTSVLFDKLDKHISCNSNSNSISKNIQQKNEQNENENDNENENENENDNNMKNKWLQFLHKTNKNGSKKSTFASLFNSFKSTLDNKDNIQSNAANSDHNVTENKNEIESNNDNNNNLVRNVSDWSEYGIASISDLLHRLSTESLKYGRDNGQYLILNSLRILDDDFEPTFIDLLQCHVRSTGLMFENHVICRSLPINKYNDNTQYQNKQDIVFRVVDVGGHRNERKKWSYVLQQQNDVIVFVVSAASFCQVLFEDFKKNAMRESISVWEDIISNNISNMNDNDSHTQFILVINKIDLFYQRCHLFNEYFPEYSGDMNNKYEILDYIKSLYLDIAKQYNKYEHVHCVCTKLTDSLEIASFDVEEIKYILMKYQLDNNEYLCRDIANTIIDYAIGDVFWSEKWIRPMWERKMKMKINVNNNNNNNCNLQKHLCLNNELTNYQSKINKDMTDIGVHNNNANSPCDHVNNPHDYHRHRKRKKKKKKKRKCNKSKSITSIFQK